MHLAAESHVDRSINGSDAFIHTNVLGTHTLLEAARAYWMGLPKPRAQAFRFLHVSTDEVYGSLGPDGAFCETTAYDPSSPYSASKAAADHLASAWHRTFGLPVVISNCSNNYGPYHFPEKLIPLVILNALEGKPLPVYGDGSNVRDWLYVEDHARALHLILTRGRLGEKYNVGGGNERTNLAVVESICDTLDRPRARRAEPAPAHHLRAPTGRATTIAMPSTPPSSRPSSAGARRRRSRPASPRPCAGISTTAPGGSRCARASTPASGSAWSRPRREPAEHANARAMKTAGGRSERPARACARRAGAAAAPASASSRSGRPQLDLLDPASIARALDADAAGRGRQRGSLHRGRQGRERRRGRLRAQSRRAGALAAAAEAAGLPDHPRLDRLRVRRRQVGAYVEDGRAQPDGRLRPLQARRRGGGRRRQRAARDPAHGLALRRAWPQFPQDHAAAGARAARAARGRRPARQSRPTRRIWPTPSWRSPAAGRQRADAWGIYHAAAAGETTWHGFASAIIAAAKPLGVPQVPVLPITTAEYPTPARRPANSCLDCGKLERAFGVRLPPWQQGLAECIGELA